MSEGERLSRGRTILIVEDDDVTATHLQNSLIGVGYSVLRARSTVDAVVTLRSTHADLILVSYMLPDADGLILCAMLKAHFPAPIIVLTAHASEVDRALALESGAINCLTKRVDRNELLAAVKAVVESPVGAQAQRR